MQYTEVLVWIIVAFVAFYLFNFIFQLRTGASIFLSIFISSITILILFNSLFSEVAITFLILAGAIYAIPRAFRDKRDDVCQKTN